MTVKKVAAPAAKAPAKAAPKKAPVKKPAVTVKATVSVKAAPAKARLDSVTAREFAYFMLASITEDHYYLKAMSTFNGKYTPEYLDGYSEAIHFFTEAIKQGEEVMDADLLVEVRQVAATQAKELAAKNG